MIRRGDEQRRWVQVARKILEHAFTGRTSACLVKSEPARICQGVKFRETSERGRIISADDDSVNCLRRAQIAHDMENHWRPRYGNENFVTAASALRNWINWAATSCEDEGGKMGGAHILQTLVHVNAESLSHQVIRSSSQTVEPEALFLTHDSKALRP